MKEDCSHLMDHKSLVQSLMKKKKMAKGGLVDNSNDLDIDSDEAQGVELAEGLTHHADFLSNAENDEPLDLHMPEYEAEEEHEGQHGRGILDKILSGVRKKHMLG